jgi:hypothetical protein
MSRNSSKVLRNVRDAEFYSSESRCIELAAFSHEHRTCVSLILIVIIYYCYTFI